MTLLLPSFFLVITMCAASKRQKVCASRLTLSNGVTMPRVGFGTYKFKEPNDAAKAVRAAVKLGYELVDTAHVYGGGKIEPAVGKAVGKDTFVVTKQWRGFHGYEETKKCLAQSLGRLDRESVDLYLMHWPGPGYSALGRSKDRPIESYFKKGHENIAELRLETWRAMEDAFLDGKCRAIGVSNFSVDHLAKLLKWPDLRVRPVVNQVELHPYLQQRDLVDLCHRENIVLQAYASLGGQDSSQKDWTALGVPPLLENPRVLAAAKVHETTPSAVLLRWALQKGFAVIPKSRNQERIAQNSPASLDRFTLSDDEMTELDLLDLGGMKGRLCWRRDELRNLDFE